MKNLFTLLLAVAALSASAQATYYSEDFENGLPAAWTSDAAWNIGESAALGSQYFPLTGNSTSFIAANDDKVLAAGSTIGAITSGPIDLTAATGKFMFFMDSYWVNGDDSGNDETAHIEVSTDGGATWTLFWDLLKTGQWGLVAKDCSDWAGQTVTLRFAYQDGGGWNYGWGIDNIRIGEPEFQKEARLVGYAGYEKALIGKELGGKIVVLNRGGENITSIEVKTNLAGDVKTFPISGLDIPFLESGIVDLPTTFKFLDGDQTLDVSITKVNGSADDLSDNDASSTLTGYPAGVPGKKIFVEEATGSWCTWCPRGTVALDRMSAGFGDHFVGVAVHNNDPMAVSAYNSGITALAGFPGFPSVYYQRTEIIDPGEIEDKLLVDMYTEPEALVTARASYDAATNKVKVIADVTPLVALSGAHKMLAVLTEDGLTGTTAQWAQVNAYSNGNNGPMGVFSYLPSPVPASLMVYDHVGRQLVSVFAGTANLLPTTMDAGTTYTVEFPEKTLAAGLNLDNVHVVVALLDPLKKAVNADSRPWAEALAATTGINVVNDAAFAQVFPNPFTDRTFIKMDLKDAVEVSIDVFNSLGQLVASQNYGKQVGELVFPFEARELPNDTYYFEVKAGNQAGTYQAVLAR